MQRKTLTRLVITSLIAGLAQTASAEACNHDGCSIEAVEAVRQLILNPIVAEPVSSDSPTPPPVEEPEQPIAPDGTIQPKLGGTMEFVEGEPRRIRRDEPKPLPTADPATYEAQNTEPLDTAPMLSLRFSAGTYTPEPGLDPALTNAIADLVRQGRQSTYGFLLSDEYLIEETRSEIERHGVTILEQHANAYKVRLPLDVETLEAALELDFVHWIGFSLPEQKLTSELQPELESPSGDELALYINLFDEDPEKQFGNELELLGVELAQYDDRLRTYTVLTSDETLAALVALDFVQSLEPVRLLSVAHDQSIPTIGADYIRPGDPLNPPLGTRFDGSSTIVGLLDTGADVNDTSGHVDLNKFTCSINYTNDPEPGDVDTDGHGSHVLGTIAGTGAALARNAGVAPGVGSLSNARIRNAKVAPKKDGTGSSIWTTNGMEFMSLPSGPTTCNSGAPQVINVSLGTSVQNGQKWKGTDLVSRTLDNMTYDYRQLYVVAAGNDGDLGSGSITTPGAAKTALTVGSVGDTPTGVGGGVGDLSSFSSLGATGDHRMKPNVVAPGELVTSVAAGSVDQYGSAVGTSMAAPHVTGLVATLFEHHPDLVYRPYLTRAYLMATSMLHDDEVNPGNNGSNTTRASYGLGRVSSYLTHWADSSSDGWGHDFKYDTVYNNGYVVDNIYVPNNAERLVVVLSWDEPAASPIAAQAVHDKIDLWVDVDADCPVSNGQCGEFSSQSQVDNVEYVIIDNPSEGYYDLKATATSVCSAGTCTGREVGIAYTYILGDPTPSTSLSLEVSDETPVIGDTFTIKTKVENSEYVAGGVRLSLTAIPFDVNLLGVETTREDNVFMDFVVANSLTLGNIRAGGSREVTWTFAALNAGMKTFEFTTESNNGSDVVASYDVEAQEPPPDLLISWESATPTSIYNGEGVSLTAKVKNDSSGQAADDTDLHFLVSDDSSITMFDTVIGSGSVPGLGPLDSFTLSAGWAWAMDSGTWYLGVCVDAVPDESDTTNQCSDAGVPVVVKDRPDLSVTNLSLSQTALDTNVPFTVHTTVTNSGLGYAEPTKLQYYLSDDASLDTGADHYLGFGHVHALFGGVTLTENHTFNTPADPGFYYVFACLDPVAGDNNPAGECSGDLLRQMCVGTSECLGAP